MVTSKTYDDYVGRGVACNFEDYSQKAIALAITRDAGALPYIWVGNLKAASSLLNRRWSSLPGGGQQELTEDEAEQCFYDQLGEKRP